MKTIKIGYAPTRRSIFSAPDALRYRNLIAKKLEELGIEFVDIIDINNEGLLYNEEDLGSIVKKFKEQDVAGIFIPHCNFGTEYLCGKLAHEMGLPLLLWGPRDERPDENGIRLRDSQCGLFATGKVLRRFNVPFTYMNNCRLDDEIFKRGINDFLAICNVVREFRNTRILQISTRPYDFMTTMYNEGELLEKFGINIAPIPMPELTKEVKNIVENNDEKSTVEYIENNMNVSITKDELRIVAALKTAMKKLALKYSCNAIVIQCWNALQEELGIMPCCANALLTEEGIPVACETDVHGAITSVLVQAASMKNNKTFFADWTVRHPDNENGELLQHCGPWPASVLKSKPTLGYPLAFNHPGAVEGESHHGDITLARFDGDHNEYSLLLGNAKGIDGPYTKGTYLWIEVKNLKRLEEKLVTGPYIHHCSGIHQNVVPILYEACKYINGLKPDLYDNNEEEIKAYLRGE